MVPDTEMPIGVSFCIALNTPFLAQG